MDSMAPLFDSLAGPSLNDAQKEIIEKVKNYFNVNMPNLYLNESYGIMTEDDLKFGRQHYKSTAWKNEMKAMKEAMGNAQEMGMSVVMSYLKWLKEQGVDTKM